MGLKGYKGFGPGLVCRGKQYAENTVFEENKAKICESGMHFCKNPLDVLDYYPLLNDDAENNEFCEVEALDEPVTDDDKKFASKRLKIGARLSPKGFIEAAVGFVFERTNDRNSGYRAQLAASGYAAQLAASGDGAKLAASGDGAKLAASGDGAQLAASGDRAKLAASGYRAQLAAGGYRAQLAAGGYGAKLAASGDRAQLAASGDRAQLAASGEKSVVCAIGNGSAAKASAGSWITLAEYDDNGEIKIVKSEMVGEKIRPNTWYTLRDGEFVETEDE